MDECKSQFKDYFLITVLLKIKFKQLQKLGKWMEVKAILRVIGAIMIAPV